ncbi:hypothetical protein ND748_03440 [Frankia sp. AiPs1]|uniref:hypothetical protein n=1 Tax=Frankia sp. AiPs1 TaxID=573493 RepID=UPI002043A697|nr:hypothetical protein [Frankia sp. AiPs1]MCM3920730.1 hypothetical protein [Frankia sp. AiPs1]
MSAFGAFDDQRDAAIRDLHAVAGGIAAGAPEPLDAGSLPDTAARELLELVYAFSDGETAVCRHLKPSAPQPAFGALWVGHVVCCEACRPAVLRWPDDPWCCCCGTSTDRVVGVSAGPLLVFALICDRCRDRTSG